MSVLVLIFGLVAGCLMAAIVGLFGSRRRIGFGWSFLLSLVFSPLIGLIVTLCTPKLPNRDRKWGCLGGLIGFIVAAALVALVLALMPEWYEQLRLWFESFTASFK
jgi:LytS/YehU family sensor histidine kinase